MTGAGGGIGEELARQAAQLGVAELILVARRRCLEGPMAWILGVNGHQTCPV